MQKQKVAYVCGDCAYESSKWLGCCPGCSAWNTFEEQQPSVVITAKSAKRMPPAQLFATDAISDTEKSRLISGVSEWDRVVGGGILPGSFLILTGDPGIGKSTLLLQVADKIAASARVFYFSSEESLAQVKGRAVRLGLASSKILFSEERSVERIIASIEAEKPDLVVIDSIQSCFLAASSDATPGSITQLREAAFALMESAKSTSTSILITGHITKVGTMAGPKLLEHMVDGVFYLQGEEYWQTRILRSVKNRFGTINEVGFFQMEEHGLAEVTDINRRLLEEATFAPGSTLICSTEGTRPLLLEAQALCIESKFGSPQRVITGTDHKRVVLIAAILEKYLHIKLSCQDIFFKVSGGVFVRESSCDLGIALALLSSYFQVPLPTKSLALGELSLTGHIKPATRASAMAKEAIKFGITTILTAEGASLPSSKQIIQLKSVYDLLRLFPEK